MKELSGDKREYVQNTGGWLEVSVKYNLGCHNSEQHRPQFGEKHSTLLDQRQ
jgi:hypothetical protein